MWVTIVIDYEIILLQLINFISLKKLSNQCITYLYVLTNHLSSINLGYYSLKKNYKCCCVLYMNNEIV